MRNARKNKKIEKLKKHIEEGIFTPHSKVKNS